VQSVVAAGADVNANDENNRTPLMFASEDGRLDLVRILLDAKAGLDARDLKSGQTPLMAAALGGHDAVVTALLEAGADRTAKDNDGETAQRLAEQSQHPNTAELLKPRPAPTPPPTKPARTRRAKPAVKPAPRP
jgi:ankyrin repeat protein